MPGRARQLDIILMESLRGRIILSIGAAVAEVTLSNFMAVNKLGLYKYTCAPQAVATK